MNSIGGIEGGVSSGSIKRRGSGGETLRVARIIRTRVITKAPGLQSRGFRRVNVFSINYGCGNTVHPRDLVNSPTVLFVGVGGNGTFAIRLFQQKAQRHYWR